jgi:cardiolipin synthase
MQQMFLDDLRNATEVVLLSSSQVRAPGAPARRRHLTSGGGGSGGRVVAGAMRVGNTVSAAITNRRVLESVEANIAVIAGLCLTAVAALAFAFPRGVAYPIAVVAAYFAAALLYRGAGLYRERRGRYSTQTRKSTPSQRPSSGQ